MRSSLHRHLLPCSFVMLLLACSNGRGDDPFREKVAPFLQTYCFKCHNEKKTEGLLDLTRYTSSTLIARDFRQWEHVITFLKEEKMPPKRGQSSPLPDERAEFLASLDKLLLIEARKLADDPGTASPRRLSNAEYNYTIRDLTGVDIRPAASFPVDPASGEGFTNTSEALVMSPNLFKKYYAAAQFVADHVLLTTTGFEFAPYPVVTFSDRQKFYEQAILRFYEQHKIDYATYLAAAWSYRHRPTSRRGVTIEAWAAENKLSPKYLRSLWNALQDDASSDVFYHPVAPAALECASRADRADADRCPAETRRRDSDPGRGHSAPQPDAVCARNAGDHLQRRQRAHPAHRSSQENGGRPGQVQSGPDRASRASVSSGNVKDNGHRHETDPLRRPIRVGDGRRLCHPEPTEFQLVLARQLQPEGRQEEPVAA